MKRLSSLDAALLYAETRECPMNVGSLRIWNPADAPNFGFAAVKDLLVARLPELPVLRGRVAGASLGLDRPWLVQDADFDLDFHIRRIALPEPGGRRELDELVGRLLSAPLDRTRPLWEQWYIEGLEYQRVATLTKYHHALIDGVSGTGVGALLYDIGPEPRPPVAQGTRAFSGPPDIPPLDRRALGAAVNVAMTPYRLLRAGQRILARYSAVRDMDDRPPHFFQAPITRFNATTAGQRQVGSSRLQLERIRAVERTFGVKLNDVLLAVVSGALRSYLQQRRELPERPLVAQMPISTRGGDSTDLGNQFTSISIRLATDVTDPAERIRAISRNTRAAKQTAKALTAHRLVGITETLPPAMLGLAARAYTASRVGRHVAPINLVVSYVRGPETPHYLAGAVGEQVIAYGPVMLDVGLNISCFSCQEWVYVGVLTTKEIAGDIDQLADAMEPSLRELERAAAFV